MHNQETINQFIQLRAHGVPYARIAKDLDVTKCTLIRWAHKHKAQIDALAAVEAEALCDKYLGSRETQIEALAARLQQLEAELNKRKPEYMPTKELTDLIRVTRARLDKLCVEPTLPEEPSDAQAGPAAPQPPVP